MFALFPDTWLLFLMYGIGIALTILLLICSWHIFIRMGQRGWKGILPFYNIWVMVKVLKKPTFWFWMQAGGLIALFWGYVFLFGGIFLTSVGQLPPFGNAMVIFAATLMLIALIIVLIYGIRLIHALSKSFGYGIGFTVGLILLPIVFMPILAFGESVFTEPEDRKPAAPSESDIEEGK